MVGHAHRREGLKAEARARIARATEDYETGRLDRGGWQRRVSSALSQAYLRLEDPRWQSGFDGDAARWRAARELVLDAVPGDGTLLDVGCANGHLMESLEAWAAERGLRLRAFGLELDPALAGAARRRLQAHADRIFTGNVSDWRPPHRFTYVRTGLEYAPPGDETALVRRLLGALVEPGGRLIVGPIRDDDLDQARRAFRDAGAAPAEMASSPDDRGGTRHVVWATGR